MAVMHCAGGSWLAAPASWSSRTREPVRPCLQQVEVAVVTQTVSVLHDTRTSATALAAALNAAALDASLQVIAVRC
jgi:hypothetical protein